MHIAYIISYMAERFGGPVCVVKNIGRVLAASGHTISYWAPANPKDRQELLSLDSAHIYDLVWPHRWYRTKALAQDLSDSAASIDVMHINGFWTHTVYTASRIATTNDIPYIIRPAGCLQPWALKHSFLKWLKKTVYLNLVGKSIMQGAACLHATSAQEAENFRQAGYRGPITAIPNGVDTNEFTSGDGSEAEAYWPNVTNRLLVLFMSRLSPEKGLDLLIPIWADLVKSAACKDALLVIAGPDDRGYQKVVEAIINGCDVGSQVLMTGMVRGREKLALLRRADIFILPSYSENFGIVVAEALACETPVITTTGTPWKQLQDVDAGRWVPPRRPDLAQALRELLDMSESELNAMGHRGRELVLEKCNWNRITRQLVNVYNCILHGKDVPLYPEPMELNIK